MKPALIFLIAVLVFFFAKVISADEIIHGASNVNVILIFLLLILSDIIKKTRVLDRSVNKLLKPNLKLNAFYARLTSIVSFFSGWVNNTPLVAFLIPYVYEWARKKNISPSKVMLPLSYAAIMGGTMTLIGTSTNLVVNGLAVESGFDSLNLFDFAYVGVPAVVLGILYLFFFGDKLLPARENILSSFSDKTRDYLVETIVPPLSKLTNKTIENAQLRNLNGLYLVQIIRDNQIIAPVSPKIVIQKNDRLFFAGDTTKILELVQGNKDLILPFGNKMIYENKNNIDEVLITNQSRLHLKTAKESNFRKKYDAAIIAIQRNGEKLDGKIGEIPLQSGDLLLLVSGPDFYKLQENEQDFFITSRVKEIDNIPQWKINLFFISLVSAFILAAFKILTLFIGLLLAIGVTALIKMVKFEDVKKSLDLNLFIIIVLALAVGRAIANSGVAASAANTMINVFHSNTIAIIISLYVITNITSMFVTNAAAVAITFPIAMAAANSLGASDITPFILTIAYAGSAEFITPFGYQTNLMVYGPGGYHFKDYIKIGLPLTLTYLVLTVLILGKIYHFY